MRLVLTFSKNILILFNTNTNNGLKITSFWDIYTNYRFQGPQT